MIITNSKPLEKWNNYMKKRKKQRQFESYNHHNTVQPLYSTSAMATLHCTDVPEMTSEMWHKTTPTGERLEALRLPWRDKD